ncbi:hypothetical protein KR222_006873, partial [Zaprionus bogoriensis]
LSVELFDLMRPVLFIFYTVEIVLHLLIMFFNVSGFVMQSMEYLPLRNQLYLYAYTAIFNIFTVVTLSASIGNCTGKQYSSCEQIVHTAGGFVVHICVSLMSLASAERDFYLMYMDVDTREHGPTAHPFFMYMRAQSVCALIVGIVYLLHCILVIDVLLSNGGSASDPLPDNSGLDLNYSPARLYVLGETIESCLAKYEWFNEFSRTPRASV